MRVEAVNLHLGLSHQPLVDDQTQTTYAVGKNGEVYITTGDTTYVVTSIEEAKRLSSQLAPTSALSAATSMNGIIDLTQVAELLDVGRNKVQILQLMRWSDLVSILQLLPKDLLINSLKLFDREKLLRMITSLPPQFMMNILMQAFQMDELIKKMPTTELMNVLRSKKLNNRELTKGLMAMDPQFSQLLLQRIYGNYDFSQLKPYDLNKLFMITPKEHLMEGLKTISFKALTPLVGGFVKQDPSLLMNLSDEFIGKLFDSLSKSSLMEACVVLPEDMLIKMLMQLPTQMLIMADSQIDTSTFEKYLISQQSGLLTMLASAA